MVRQFKCPSCGADHSVTNPGVQMAVCEYCENAVVWDGEAIRNLGQQATLSEGFTRLYRGAGGLIYGKRFLVLGRARYSFGRGFWDEWHVEYEGQAAGWVTEDNHQIALQRPLGGFDMGRLDAWLLGSAVNVQGTQYVVHEVGQARCLGVEGQLPRAIAPGETFGYVDATSPDGLYVLGLEFRDPPAAFSGRWVPHGSMVLDDEGGQW